MQPPITVGTVLQNRYRIIQILGQGGFGRTYLAEDQRRFNEPCAIKELILTATGSFALEKAQELFQRESAILYQIDHPQVPKFRERFEQDDRLFLVEDYVAGKTYRALLAERLAEGLAFTEAEVLQWLISLLPVLQHIHSLGIIHRDISPENIILRAGDDKPVLIDFGVVKELATRLQSPDTTPVTSVGKLGYSPSEQMQTGQAYPSSDLYALGVTAIVLLTGKEATALFDQTQLTWNWQQWVGVNPLFAEVLQRMLNYKPSDRYQSAADVLQALQSLDQPHVSIPVSHLQTIAVGHRPDPLPPSSFPNKPHPVILKSRDGSILDSPFAVGAIGSAVVILAGLGSWALVNSIRSQSKTTPEAAPPQTFPSPVISGSTTPTPTATPTSTPTPTPTKIEFVVLNKRLNLGASNTTKVDDTLKANQIFRYSFIGEVGQKLTASVDQGSGILLTILRSNRQPIDNQSLEVQAYEGILPSTGRYTIQLSLAPSVAASDYTLNVSLENPVKATPTPTPTPTVTPTPTPTITPTATPSPTTSEEPQKPEAEITPTPAPGETSSP
ncbi:serine/threonine protein kinase [Cylindrospermum stagnale PCC 7417]|uniref:non-specific serine/threonine protein kinase n=1 Tax=Cylindrospermum stagnale PCC 7417 TaxID=56107 RepID=K9X5J4_9NOST|nr:serine/threonine-protein kinase [Cylindrospermum stagnale]AFZ27748.1 serine/threonine protein kinase [Cylindrospermum stagnale PCC 7417]